VLVRQTWTLSFLQIAVSSSRPSDGKDRRQDRKDTHCGDRRTRRVEQAIRLARTRPAAIQPRRKTVRGQYNE
jgi:hypothetical protein